MTRAIMLGRAFRTADFTGYVRNLLLAVLSPRG